MLFEEFKNNGEFAASGAFEEPDRSLFCRKALGIRRYYENCNLHEYNGKPLYPSGTKKDNMIIRPDYLNGLTIYHNEADESKKEIIQKYQDVFFRYSSKLPLEHTVGGNMYNHGMPNYGRIIREGFNSYAERIKKMKDSELRDGLMHIYEGIKSYVARCVNYLENAGADEKLINALKKVPLGKADNIYEAIVSWNFVMYLDCCDNLGCLAKELYDFYKGEDILPLLENLYDNIDSNGGYSMALNTDYNELTIQCLRASKGRRRPMIELFVDENTPNEIWSEAFKLMRLHGGQPSFYNPKLLLGQLKERFNISDEDIKSFCGVGCTESSISGCTNVGSTDAGINLLLIVENVIKQSLKEVKTFEEFYNIYISEVKKVIDDVTEKISLSQKERSEFNPLPMRTLLTDDCIDKETEYHNGGARYNWSIVSFAGMINTIDSLLVIKKFIFEEKRYSAEVFCKKLSDNNDDFLLECRKCETAFGCDNLEANSFTEKLTTEIYSMLDNKVPYLGGGFLPASIQFCSQVEAGRYIGATPDGRKAGQPLCDSLGAIFSKDKKGPTALLKSVTSIALRKAIGTPVLNFNIDKSWNDDVLKGLILSYMQMGGIQMQITCISEKELKEAYEHPEEHENLVVRVGGYSEYFCRLSDELKKMIINRTIQKM